MRTCGRAPSTRSTEPLTKLAAGLSRNTMAAEVSASVPKRPAARCCASRAASARLRAGSGPCRWRRCSRARRRSPARRCAPTPPPRSR
jgi:hypothetical protein